MRAIFISYRRDDAEGHAGRLFADLVEHFGDAAVFMDVATIEPGKDFRRVIDEHVASCGVLLAVIGKNWLSATDANGRRRLDDPADFVRIETVSALKRDIPVVPVLVQGATMPTAMDLPQDLADLAYRNGVELTHARWSSDVQLLIDALRPHVERGSPEHNKASVPHTEALKPIVNRVPYIAATIVLAGAVGIMVWWSSRSNEPRTVVDFSSTKVLKPVERVREIEQPQRQEERVQPIVQPVTVEKEIKPDTIKKSDRPAQSALAKPVLDRWTGTDWMEAADLAKTQGKQPKDLRFPRSIQGREHAGKLEVRAKFGETPSGVSRYYYFVGWPEAVYRQRAVTLRNKGFTEYTRHAFINDSGERIYQTVWLSRSSLSQ